MRPCRPRSAVGVAMHELALLIEHRLVAGMVGPLQGGADIRLLPPPCPLKISVGDFSQASTLISRGRQASIRWLEARGIALPGQARFSLHGRALLDSASSCR